MDNKKITNIWLLFLAFVYLVCQGASVALFTVDAYVDIWWICVSAVMAIICFALYFTYRTHNKNVMKPLIGAALMLVLYFKLFRGLYFLQNIDKLSEWYPEEDAFLIYAYTYIVLFVVVALINIVHYIINGTHKSRPGLIKFNKALVAIFVAVTAVQAFSCVFEGCSVMIMLSDVLDILGDAILVIMAVIIESSLDEFKLKREAKALENPSL